MKIAICLIATNKYIKFFWDIESQINKYFLPNHDVFIYLFTNKNIKNKTRKNTMVQKITHEPWPMMTTKRFHFFNSIKEELRSYDYIYYLDVDMKIVSNIDNEVLGSLVATKHPGYENTNSKHFPVCKNPSSKAYIENNKDLLHYYAGGFFGGKSFNFLEMANNLEINIEQDLKNNSLPKWHDESHLNHYLKINPPEVVLNSNYCFDEKKIDLINKKNIKIIALDKDHDLYRNKFTYAKRLITKIKLLLKRILNVFRIL